MEKPNEKRNVHGNFQGGGNSAKIAELINMFGRPMRYAEIVRNLPDIENGSAVFLKYGVSQGYLIKKSRGLYSTPRVECFKNG